MTAGHTSGIEEYRGEKTHFSQLKPIKKKKKKSTPELSGCIVL